MWIATNELPRTGGHPFYQRLNQVLDGDVLPPLLIGYFEGIDSEAASPGGPPIRLRGFLGLGLDGPARALDDLADATAGLVKGKTIGIDATMLEANAALRSIVCRDGGESYEEFLTKLAKASGIATPTRAGLARIDRKRKKKGSNDDWTHPHDPDAKITKMKDGRTHLAHKAERVFIDDAITAIWTPRRDHTRSDGESLGLVVAESVA